MLAAVQAQAGTVSVYSPGAGSSGLVKNTIIGTSPSQRNYYNPYNAYNHYNAYRPRSNRYYQNNNRYDRYRYNNPHYNNYNGYNRRPIIFRSMGKNNADVKKKESLVAYNPKYANYEYPRITEAEKTILGRTYEKQELGLRLNRLERSVFNKTYPTMSYEQRVNNIIVNYNGNTNTEIPLSALTRLEEKVMNKNYSFDTPQVRIERLEERMLGASQSGNLRERYNKLAQASKSYDRQMASKYPQYSQYSGYSNSPYGNGSQYYSPPIVAGGGWRGMLGSMGNYLLGGCPTGMSPQMDPAYMDTFEAERYYGDGGESTNIRTNRGYSNSNIQRGSSTGVTILD